MTRVRLRGLLGMVVALVVLTSAVAWAVWSDQQQAVGAETSSYLIPTTTLDCETQGNSATIAWTGQTVPVPLQYEVFLNGSSTPTTVTPEAGRYSVRFNFGLLGFGTRSVRVVPTLPGTEWVGPASSRSASRGLLSGVSCGPQT
ncbi:hypothetical protein KLP28_07710 [Nocardioidaceae bacterium]|nr:hypothetical protein KLP28_07710 [Nocardioidaceae bacterium]